MRLSFRYRQLLPELEDHLYIHDVDFKPRQEASLALPPGSPQSALEREILRRLFYTVNKRAIRCIEDLASLCPKGLALEEATKHFLCNVPASTVQQKTRERALWFTDYVARPPTMAEFLSDPKYLGASLGGGGQGSGLWPAWQTLLVNQFDLDSFVHNVVLTGGIGIGKTLILVLLVLYRICLVAHLRDPRRFFDLSPGGPISFVIMSVTKETVRATAWQQALRWMQRSPFFCHDTGFDPARSYSDLRVELRSLTANGHDTQLVLSGGSQPQHLIGRDTLVKRTERQLRSPREVGAWAATEKTVFDRHERSGRNMAVTFNTKGSGSGRSPRRATKRGTATAAQC